MISLGRDTAYAGVAKVKEIGKNIGKNVGTKAKDFGNKAAYIAGGAGLVARAIGNAVLARREKPETKTANQATFGATNFCDIQKQRFFKHKTGFTLREKV